MADWEKDDPLVIERGEGNYLFDTEGRKYFDGVSSLWVNLFGHRRKEIDHAVRTQLDRMAHSTFLGLSHVPAIELAEKLLAAAPPGLSRVFYSDNGSTAMEIAIKMAFQYWRQREGGAQAREEFPALSAACSARSGWRRRSGAGKTHLPPRLRSRSCRGRRGCS